MSDQIQGLTEKCAVVGVSMSASGTDAARITYQALFALQHRGVEASGIVADGDDTQLNIVRAPGMVRDVFHEEEIAKLVGKNAVGHNRYSTNGDKMNHLQPVISRDINFAFAHNGNIPDTSKLQKYLEKRRYKVEGKYNDSEMLGQTIASKLHSGRSIDETILEVAELTVGAYSCTALYDGHLIGFRDPHGIRPLEIGKFEGGMVLASETAALETVGAEYVRSVEPGELVIIKDGKITKTVQFATAVPKLDMFELVYFARHDSYLYGQRVNEIRRRFGYELARLHAPWQKDLSNAVVIPVPDTSVPAAEGYAEATGLPHEMAIIKNRYVGRTFMQTSQALRRSSLQLKHTMISERIAGKDVYLIDDSIVRGNTIPRLVQLARDMKALSVSVLVASPPVRYPDFYGIDTPSQSDLIAANKTVEQMREYFKADYLGFLSISTMVHATNVAADKFNLAAFNGEYPIAIGKYAKDIHPPVSTEYMD